LPEITSGWYEGKTIGKCTRTAAGKLMEISKIGNLTTTWYIIMIRVSDTFPATGIVCILPVRTIKEYNS